MSPSLLKRGKVFIAQIGSLMQYNRRRVLVYRYKFRTSNCEFNSRLNRWSLNLVVLRNILRTSHIFLDIHFDRTTEESATVAHRLVLPPGIPKNSERIPSHRMKK